MRYFCAKKRKIKFSCHFPVKSVSIPYGIYDGCRMIKYYNAIDFKEEYKDAINGQKVSASFRKLYDETSEEDNMIVQIVHLKKDRPNLALAKERVSSLISQSMTKPALKRALCVFLIFIRNTNRICLLFLR